MDIKVSVNFDFGKLSDKLDDILDEYTSGYAKDAEQGSKDNIDKSTDVTGQAFKDVSDARKRIREYEGFPKNPPLKASGFLYKNIKSKGNALILPEYGKRNNDGFVTPINSLGRGKKVPARPFIATTAKNKQKLDKKFMQDVNKSLRIKEKVVSLK
tara:strand:- start:353 stop:820 length:468 start_codon:yes stop_codon:yes gene_type:complete